MTLRLLRKHPTTRSSIRPTTSRERGRRCRAALCGLLAACLLLSMAEVEASKTRRRSSPLDRLKRRSATARWDELRHTWMPPRTEDGSAADATHDSSPAEDAAGHETGADRPTGSDDTPLEPAMVADPEPARSAGPGTPFRAVSGPEAGAGVPPWITAGPSGVEVDGLPPLPPTEPQPELNSPAETPEPAIEPVPSTAEDLYELPRAPGAIPRTASVRDVLPKPITEILPYHDYAPHGEDPCEFMCPRPEGCPPDAEAKPCPVRVELPEVTADGRAFLAIHMLWEPTNLFHNPLYFEDHTLERYGHTHNPVLQPLVSVGKFGVQLIGLPYQLALHPPCERQFTLGWHRPGECVPYRYHLPPWNTKAALTAAAAYTGLIFLIP